MSEAWISARAGCAVVLTPEECFLLEAGRSTPPRACAPGLLSNLKALASDLLRVPAEVFPFPEVQRALDTSWRQESALTLLLTAVDSDLSSGVRVEAMEMSERLLADEEVWNAVRFRLLSSPLPEIADTKRVWLIGRVAALITEAWDRRSRVEAADRAWKRAAFQTSIPLSSSEVERLRRFCISRGGFAALVTSNGVDWLKLRDQGGLDENQSAFLHEWFLAFGQESQESVRPASASAFVPPKNELEERIAAIWKEVLGLEAVGMRDNFFDLGGDSLEAVETMSRIRSELHADLPLISLFKAPTINSLAASLEGSFEREDLPQRDVHLPKKAAQTRRATAHRSRRH